jgi:hypothetical protein
MLFDAHLHIFSSTLPWQQHFVVEHCRLLPALCKSLEHKPAQAGCPKLPLAMATANSRVKPLRTLVCRRNIETSITCCYFPQTVGPCLGHGLWLWARCQILADYLSDTRYRRRQLT